MPKRKIDRVKLNQLIRSGKSQREIAQVFGVSEAAVSKARKELNVCVVKNVALENAHRVVDKELNTVEQLQRINELANEILTLAYKAAQGKKLPEGMTIDQPWRVIFRAMKEIREQLELQLEIYQCLFDTKAVAEFQDEVLDTIKGVSPEIRQVIIERLRQKRAVRAVVQFD